jgi:hypothetical protein
VGPLVGVVGEDDPSEVVIERRGNRIYVREESSNERDRRKERFSQAGGVGLTRSKESYTITWSSPASDVRALIAQ